MARAPAATGLGRPVARTPVATARARGTIEAGDSGRESGDTAVRLERVGELRLSLEPSIWNQFNPVLRPGSPAKRAGIIGGRPPA